MFRQFLSEHLFIDKKTRKVYTEVIKQYKNCVKDPKNAGIGQNLSIKKLVTAAQELTTQYNLQRQLLNNRQRLGIAIKNLYSFIERMKQLK